MFYIQRKVDGFEVAVDEFETMQEAKALLKEYRLSDTSEHYYLSSRCCNAWKER